MAFCYKWNILDWYIKIYSIHQSTFIKPKYSEAGNDSRFLTVLVFQLQTHVWIIKSVIFNYQILKIKNLTNFAKKLDKSQYKWMNAWMVGLDEWIKFKTKLIIYSINVYIIKLYKSQYYMPGATLTNMKSNKKYRIFYII